MWNAYILKNLQHSQVGHNFASKEEADLWLVAKAEELLALGECLDAYDFYAVRANMAAAFSKVVRVANQYAV